jgi:hypothetical protein
MNCRTLVGLVLVMTGLLPRTLPAFDQQTIKDRTDQLQKISSVERDRLDRNIEAFRKLAPAQKERYRELHRKLAEDRMQSGRLTGLLQTYAVWVETLTPTQRDELQRETDHSRKLALVRRFKEEHDHPVESPDSQQDPHSDEPPPVPTPSFNPRAALDAKDLTAVMKVIVASLPSDRTRPEFSQPGIAEYIGILNASAQSASSYREWPDDALLQKMIGVLSKDPLQTVKKAESKREALIRLMLIGVRKQVYHSVRLPTVEERMQTHQSLTLLEREQIMKRPKEKIAQFITRKYFESKGDDSLAAYRKIPEYHRQIADLFDRFEVPRPPGMQRVSATGHRLPNISDRNSGDR